MKKKLYLVFSISFFLVTIFLIGYEVISNITHKDPTPSIVLRPFTINDNLEDGNGKKATIILLAGQSNAAGVSHNDYLEKNVTEDKFNEYNQGYDNVYINYYSSVLNESSGFVKCKLGQGYRSEFFGPELGLAEKLNQMYPDQQFFIIKFAEGATNLFYHWVSPSSNKVGGQYYYDFVNFDSGNYLNADTYKVPAHANSVLLQVTHSNGIKIYTNSDYSSLTTNSKCLLDTNSGGTHVIELTLYDGIHLSSSKVIGVSVSIDGIPVENNGENFNKEDKHEYTSSFQYLVSTSGSFTISLLGYRV